MITIKHVRYAEIESAPNYAEIIAEYGAECSIPEIGPVSPQPSLYAALEQSGGFHLFGVYSGETLIGFVSVLIYTLPHYGQKIATTESIFLAAAHRNSSTGADMLHLAKLLAKEQGCKVLLCTAPVGSRFGRLLSLQSRHTNDVYCVTL